MPTEGVMIMSVKYFGWIGTGGYKNVVIVENMSEAKVFNRASGELVVKNEYLKAMWDPGSEFEEISEAEAKKILEKLQNEK